MRIGVDLDGVVFNSEMFFMAKGEIYDCKILKKNSIVNAQEPRVQNKYDWTQDEINGYIKNYSCDENFDVMPCASEVIKYLQEEGHKIYIISARGQFFEDELKIAKKKLKKAGIKADKYHWKHFNKTEICINEKIDIMIDDRYDVCQDLSKLGILCLYFKMAGRKTIPESETLREVHNWGEVYRIISDVKGEK